MLWKLGGILERWLYFGFSREKAAAARAEIDRHNAHGLMIASPVAAAIFILFSFYPGGRFHYNIIYAIFALIQIFVFSYGAFLIKQKASHAAHLFGLFFYTTLLFVFGMYICIFDQGLYTVRFLLFILSIEVVFVYGALFSLALNASIVILFYLFYLYAKKIIGIEIAMNSIYDIFNAIICAIIVLIMNWYISYTFLKSVINTAALEAERNLYHEESIRDQLTGLNNRRSFEQSVPFYISVCRHVHQTVCAIMMDIDFFKNYNDHYGHQKGDVVLQTVGRVLNSMAEDEKIFAARVGGEEFIVLWTENRIVEAERVALKIRQLLIDEKIPHEFSQAAPYVTASFGLYIMRGGSMDTSEELYKNADSALYKAKAEGRNRIVCLDSQDNGFRDIELRDYNELIR